MEIRGDETVTITRSEFKIHQLSGYIEKIFIIEYPEKLLILDGGSGCDASEIYQYICTELGHSIKNVKLIVVSHIHPDHAGAAVILRRQYGLPIAAHPSIDNWYKNLSGLTQYVIDIMMALFVAQKRKRPLKNLFFRSRFINPDFTPIDNAPLPYFPDWSLLYLPGHTGHDIGLYHRKEQILYVADLILRLNNKFLPPFPITLPELFTATLRRIKDLKVGTLLMAHGGYYYLAPQQWQDLIAKLLPLSFPSKLKLLKPFCQVTGEINRIKGGVNDC